MMRGDHWSQAPPTPWCTPLSPLTVNHTIVPNDLSPLLVTWGVWCLANVLRAIANSCVLREIVCLLSNVFNQSMGDGFDSSILCDGKPDGEWYGSWQIPGGQCSAVCYSPWLSLISTILKEQECVTCQTQYADHVLDLAFCVEYFGFVSLGL